MSHMNKVCGLGSRQRSSGKLVIVYLGQKPQPFSLRYYELQVHSGFSLWVAYPMTFSSQSQRTLIVSSSWTFHPGLWVKHKVTQALVGPGSIWSISIWNISSTTQRYSESEIVSFLLNNEPQTPGSRITMLGQMVPWASHRGENSLGENGWYQPLQRARCLHSGDITLIYT